MSGAILFGLVVAGILLSKKLSKKQKVVFIGVVLLFTALGFVIINSSNNGFNINSIMNLAEEPSRTASTSDSVIYQPSESSSEWITVNDNPNANKPVIRRYFVANGAKIKNIEAYNDDKTGEGSSVYIDFEWVNNNFAYKTLIGSCDIGNSTDYQSSYEDLCSYVIPIWKNQIPDFSGDDLEKYVSCGLPTDLGKHGLVNVMFISLDKDFNPVTYIVFEVELP